MNSSLFPENIGGMNEIFHSALDMIIRFQFILYLCVLFVVTGSSKKYYLNSSLILLLFKL